MVYSKPRIMDNPTQQLHILIYDFAYNVFYAKLSKISVKKRGGEKMKKERLKAYFWKECDDAEGGISVIAENVKEAKKIGWKEWEKEYGDSIYDFIDCRCRLQKNGDVKGLKKGAVLDLKDGIRRGLYSYVFEDCELCGVQFCECVYKGKLLCEDCYDKLKEEDDKIEKD